MSIKPSYPEPNVQKRPATFWPISATSTFTNSRASQFESRSRYHRQASRHFEPARAAAVATHDCKHVAKYFHSTLEYF